MGNLGAKQLTISCWRPAKESATATKAKQDTAFRSSCCPSTVTANKSTVQIPHFRKKSNWERYLKDSEKTCQLMVINLTATWCEPYKKAEESMKNLSKEFTDVKFAKVDVDHLTDVAKEWNVKIFPAFLLMKRDKESNMGKEVAKEGKGVDKAKEGNMGKEVVKEGNTGKGSNEGDKDKENKSVRFEVVDRIDGFEEGSTPGKIIELIRKNKHMID